MRKFILRTLAASLVFGSLALAAPPHNHSDHLWTADESAYQSYRLVPASTWPSTREPNPPAPTPPSPNPTAPPRTSAIDTKYLVESLAILSGEKDTVLANRGKPEGRDAARKFLKEEFESFGFKVTEHAFRSGANIVAERLGKSGKILIVSAHFDSVNNAGADDDGTGVVAMLATAKLLRGKELKHTVRFVAFDQEEIGLVGSAAYAKSLVENGERANVLGDVQMEMMGYNSRNDGRFHVISCDRPDSQFMVDTFTAVVAELNTGLVITRACTTRSDHSSFWDNGMPAIVMSENFFGGDATPCYHQKCDKMDRMHIPYFEKVAQASANVVLNLVAE